MYTLMTLGVLYVLLYIPGQILLLRGCHLIIQLDGGSEDTAENTFTGLNFLALGFILWPVYLIIVWAIIFYAKFYRAVKNLLFTEDQIDDILMKKDHLAHRIREWAAR